MKFMQFKIIFNLRQRKLQCTNANAFDNHQANQCREMMNTHYIRRHCRFIFGSSAIAMRLRIRTPPLLLRDTYTKRTPMYRRTHHWARSHSSYLKRRHSLAAMYTKPYFYCFSFALVSFVRFHFHVVRSFVRSYVWLLLPFNGRCSQPYYILQYIEQWWHARIHTALTIYRCVTMLFRLYVFVRACVRIMVGH